MPVTSREIRLKQRPRGMPQASDFELAEASVADPQDGQFLVRNVWMSVDPYMRGRMTEQKSYVESFQIDQPLDGGCIGQVAASKNADFAKGDFVLGQLGWREYWLSGGQGVAKVDPSVAPVEAFLGPLGMPGMTAYAGMTRVLEIKEGDRLFVSAAAGAVGSVACQIGKIKGCYVAGTAGRDEKIEWLLQKAKIDAALNYRTADDLDRGIAEMFPDGIDAYFENVGGDQLESALRCMNDFGRIAFCGMIAQYNEPVPPPGPRSLILAIPRRLKMQGFIVTDHMDLRGQFLQDMGQWMAEGRIQWERTVVEGLENAVEAFLGLFSGENIGKMLVKLA